jgi:hypothetical protein
MMKTRNACIAMAMLPIFMLAGCNNARPPAAITDDLNRRFDGESANEFFFQYGFPTETFEYSDGNTVYKWTSSCSRREPSAVSVHRFTSPQGTYEIVADNVGGKPQAQYCEMRIYADSENTIQGFAVMVDTMGKFGSSRCSEIFEEMF